MHPQQLLLCGHEGRHAPGTGSIPADTASEELRFQGCSRTEHEHHNWAGVLPGQGQGKHQESIFPAIYNSGTRNNSAMQGFGCIAQKIISWEAVARGRCLCSSFTTLVPYLGSVSFLRRIAPPAFTSFSLRSSLTPTSRLQTGVATAFL